MRLPRLALASLPVAALGIAAASCGSPVPPVPQAAYTVSLVSNGAACNIVSNNGTLGDVSDHDRKQVVQNGPMAQVTCSVIANADGSFKVDASAGFGADSWQMSIPSITPAATLMSPAQGSGSYSSDGSAGVQYSSDTKDPCNFYFISGSGEAVSAGKIWVAFKCPVVKSGMSTCEIKQGYALFENCTTTAPKT